MCSSHAQMMMANTYQAKDWTYGGHAPKKCVQHRQHNDFESQIAPNMVDMLTRRLLLD